MDDVGAPEGVSQYFTLDHDVDDWEHTESGIPAQQNLPQPYAQGEKSRAHKASVSQMN